MPVAGKRLASSVFTFLFAGAFVFDLKDALALPLDSSAFSPTRALPLAVGVLAVWTLLKPSSLLRSVTFFAGLLVAIVIRMPFVANHTFFESLVLITVLTCFVSSQEAFYERFAPLLRLEVLAIYFWAAFHKLNTGFFDDRISCATVQLFEIKSVIPFLPTPEWFISINPYLTLLIEGLIPILLVIPRTRIYGLIVGLCFHGMLGLGYPSFSVLMYSFLSLFVPPASYDRISATVGGLWRRIPYRDRLSGPVIQLGLVLSTLSILWVFIGGGDEGTFLFSKEGLYLILSVVLGIAFLYFVVRLKPIGIDDKLTFLPQMKWLLILPAIVILNGVLPHVGAKNIQAMAMFSNLQTEGGKTNHLLFPASWQLSDNLKDLVSIRSSNYAALNQLAGEVVKKTQFVTTVAMPRDYVEYSRARDREFRFRFKYRIPFVMLQNLVSEMARDGNKNIALVYERGGEVFSTAHAELDPTLSRASVFQKKLLSQRAVPDDERGICMW